MVDHPRVHAAPRPRREPPRLVRRHRAPAVVASAVPLAVRFAGPASPSLPSQQSLPSRRGPAP
jgi:hypothetical protein